jgi:hypothetical protein
VARGRISAIALASLAALAPAASADTVGVPTAVPGTVVFFGVACPTTTTCLAVGDDLLVPIRDGIPQAPIPVPGTFELKGIACESATSCIAVGNNASNVGVVVPITGTTPGVPITVPGTISIDSIACPSATGCTAIGTSATTVDGVVVSISGTTPGMPISVAPIRLTAIACQTPSSCTAVGDNNSPSFAGVVMPITNGMPGPPVTVPGNPPGLDAIACQTATSCTAVGNNENNFGVVVPIQGGTPAAAVKPRRYAAFFGVACESATTCEGVGQTGIGTQKGGVVPILSGHPSSPIPAPGDFARPSLNAVACMSATSCEVVGTSGYTGLVAATCIPAPGQGCAELTGPVSSHHATIIDQALYCAGAPGQTCVVANQVRTLHNRLVARKTITIRPGHVDELTFKLSRAGKRLLNKLGKLHVTLTIFQRLDASRFVILKRRLTLRR